MPNILLKKLRCHDTTESGEDEVFIDKHVDGASGGTKIWGVKDVNEPNHYNINQNVNFNTRVEIKVWEHDTASPNDLIGSISISSQRGNFSEHMSGDGGDYNLDYSVRD